MAVRRATEYAHEVGKTSIVLARTHSEQERQALRQRGVREAVVGELELALELGRRTLDTFGIDGERIDRSLEEARERTS